MATPLIETLAAGLLTDLNAITVANGYNQTLLVRRPKRDDFKDITPEDLRGLLAMGEPEKPADGEACGCAEWIQPFDVTIFVIDSDTSSDTFEKRCNQVACDIHKKLKIDPTRGGNAIRTFFDSPEIFDDGEGFSGVNVPVRVHYRTKEGDPYSKI